MAQPRCVFASVGELTFDEVQKTQDVFQYLEKMTMRRTAEPLRKLHYGADLENLPNMRPHGGAHGIYELATVRFVIANSCMNQFDVF